MQFGLGLAPFDRWASIDELAGVVEAADRLGYDYVSLPDHVIIPEGPEQPRSGVVFPDVIALSSYLAGRTSRVRFLFMALVLPLREPVLLAKQLATLDWASGGRVSVVVGSGWLRSELEALAIDYHDRGDRTDECLRVLKVCWTEARPSFAGRWTSFPPSAVEPKCVQVPHIPLLIGGNGPRPERRVVELGDGWAPLTGTFEEQATAIARLKRAAAAAGRDPDRLAFVGGLAVGEPDAQSVRLARGHHVTASDSADAERRRSSSVDDARARAAEAAAAGFTHLGVILGAENTDELIERMAWFADTVISHTASSR